MRGESAISHAIDLSRAPSLLPHLRRRPLPPNVILVIRVAAGCPETTAAAVASTGRGAAFLKAAASFYVQQVLCFSGADQHRTLGLDGSATLEEMRLHMRHLLMGLHPDRSKGHDASAARVIAAWRQLGGRPVAGMTPPKAPSRRRGGGRVSRGYKPTWVAEPLARPGIAAARRAFFRRSLALAVFICGLVAPDLDVFDGEATPSTPPPSRFSDGPPAVPSTEFSRVGTTLP